ncbi:MAG: helix-turn-helix domain-containing protein [Deltaproteobacteria bacterium]|nr:helix-turn-helix domain-containing protein [Deltaproteobacteria bacterium]
MAPAARQRRHRTQPDPSARRVGARVRQLRLEAGFTFDAFVEEVGLGRGYVSELERGLVVPSLTALERLAAALDVTAADLVATASPRARLYEATRTLPPAEVSRLAAQAEALHRAGGAEPGQPVLPLRTVSASAARRTKGAVPLSALRPAAGPFSAAQSDATEAWVVVPLRVPSKKGLFVAAVEGTSMVPTVPDGAYCLFQRPWPAPKPGEVGIFVRWESERTGRFTLKEYRPEPLDGPGGLAVGGALRGHARAFPPIRHREGAEAEERPFARLVRVLPGA